MHVLYIYIYIYMYQIKHRAGSRTSCGPSLGHSRRPRHRNAVHPRSPGTLTNTYCILQYTYCIIVLYIVYIVLYRLYFVFIHILLYILYYPFRRLSASEFVFHDAPGDHLLALLQLVVVFRLDQLLTSIGRMSKTTRTQLSKTRILIFTKTSKHQKYTRAPCRTTSRSCAVRARTLPPGTHNAGKRTAQVHGQLPR